LPHRFGIDIVRLGVAHGSLPFEVRVESQGDYSSGFGALRAEAEAAVGGLRLDAEAVDAAAILEEAGGLDLHVGGALGMKKPLILSLRINGLCIWLRGQDLNL
jgi:hypothetical protein